jgi:antitoxin component YwqK of YwqJK toxin-antitoxin module
MKWNTILLSAGLLGLGVVGASQGLRTAEPEAHETYWANGQVQTRVELSDGVPEGRSTRWHPDGTKQAEGDFSDGRMEGRWEFWNADGTADESRTGTYRAGVRIDEHSLEGERTR